MKLQNLFTDYKKIFIFLSIIIGITLPVLSFDFGITEDEQVHNQHGKSILNFFLGESDNAIRSPIDSTGKLKQPDLDEQMNDRAFMINIYPGAFDLLCAGVEKYFSPFDTFETRHIVNSLFGVLLIIFSGLTAQWIGGWRAGIVTLLLMVLSPRIIGHSMNNPKDIPFAALYMFSLYFIFRFVQELPRLRIKTWLPLLIALPLACNIRISGLLLSVYLIVFVCARWGKILFEKKLNPEDIKIFFRSLVITLLICTGSYFLISVLWPWAHTNPFTAPLLSLKLLSGSFISFNSMQLFDGRWINRWEVPWYFIPKWLIIGYPLFIPLGIASSILFFKKKYLNLDWEKIWPIAFAFLFPISYVILKNSYTYDDGRHLLFTYPPLVIFCALSFENVLRINQKKYFRAAFVLLISITMIQPLYWMFKNHPNENVYFSPLIGGVNGAWKKYETDYWGNSVRQAVEWIQNNVKPEKGETIRIRNWYGDQMKAKYYIEKVKGYVHVMAPDNSPDWDYSIFQTIQCKFYPDVLFNWPPPGTVHEIKADNTPLCAIIKNPRIIISAEIIIKAQDSILTTRDASVKLPGNLSHDEYINLSLKFFNEGKFIESIEACKLALQKNPYSVLAYNNMCAAYNSINKWQEAKKACEMALAIQYDFQLAKNNLEWTKSQMKK